MICIGKYTKLNSILASKEKEYIAKVKIGIETDTLDITGNILREKEEKLDVDLLKETLEKFPKKYIQEVPKYSAVKVNGKRLYEYARDNEKVKLPKREVSILSLELISYDDSFTFKTLVSKGTYIRSLIRDILKKMRLIGCMEELKRTRQGIFDIKDSYTLSEIEKDKYRLLKLKDILDIPKVTVSNDLKKKIINGCILYGDYPENVLFLDEDGNELALYKKIDESYRVEVML